MLRTIEISQVAPSDGGQMGDADSLSSSPVIKRASIERAREVVDTLERAKTRADEIVRRAKQQAVEIRAAAFRDGVDHGVRAALAPVAAMISQWESVNQSTRNALADALSVCLGDLFRHEPALGALLERLLAAHLPDRPESVRICVPVNADLQGLQRRCEALGIAATIEMADVSDQFCVGWSGHLWTAHLGEISNLTLSEAAWKSVGASEAEVTEICRIALLEEAKALSARA